MSKYSYEEFPEGRFHKDLTFHEKILVAVSLLRSIPYVLHAAIVYYFPSSNAGNIPLQTFVYAAFVRKMAALLPLNVIQASGYAPVRVLLDTPAVKSLAPAKNNYNTPFGDPSLKVRWLHEVPNRTKEDPVIIYFPGGGYVVKIVAPLVQWLSSLLLRLDNKRVSIAILDYSTAPHFVFPDQLEEAFRAYTELSTTSNRIAIIGGSAGGHLLATLLFRLKSLNKPPPYAVFFVSPMLELINVKEGSWIEFQDIDFNGYELYEKVCNLFAHVKDKKEANPMLGTAEDWGDAIPKNSAAVWGAKETLRDSIRKFFEKAIVSDTLEEVDGIHDIMLFSIDGAGSKFAINIFNKWFQQT